MLKNIKVDFPTSKGGLSSDKNATKKFPGKKKDSTKSNISNDPAI